LILPSSSTSYHLSIHYHSNYHSNYYCDHFGIEFSGEDQISGAKTGLK